MPNVSVYVISFGKKDRQCNIGFIYRVEGFRDDALVKVFSHQIGTLQIFVILN